MRHRFIRELIPFRYLKLGIQALKKILPYDANKYKFLWLNNQVTYKRKPLYIEKFIDAGLCFHTQLLDNDHKYLSLDDISCKFKFVG